MLNSILNKSSKEEVSEMSILKKLDYFDSESRYKK